MMALQMYQQCKERRGSRDRSHRPSWKTMTTVSGCYRCKGLDFMSHRKVLPFLLLILIALLFVGCGVDQSAYDDSPLRLR